MLQGHGGEPGEPFPASVLALWLLELTWSLAIADAAAANGGTCCAAPGFRTSLVGVALMVRQALDS